MTCVEETNQMWIEKHSPGPLRDAKQGGTPTECGHLRTCSIYGQCTRGHPGTATVHGTWARDPGY